MRIIPEAAGARAAVLALNRRAFDGDIEAKLIERLDSDGQILASLVAVDGEAIIGHILFSPLSVTAGGAPVRCAALAPMCVEPQRQRQGVGSRLVAAGVAAMRNAGQQAVIVLGHEHYYPRFGFRHDLVRNLACDYNGYLAFMGLELAEDSLAGKVGTCRYPEAFTA